MSNKIGYGTKVDSIMATSFQRIFPAPYIKVITGSSKFRCHISSLISGSSHLKKNGMYVMEDMEENIRSNMRLVKLRRIWKIGFGLS